MILTTTQKANKKKKLNRGHHMLGEDIDAVFPLNLRATFLRHGGDVFAVAAPIEIAGVPRQQKRSLNRLRYRIGKVFHGNLFLAGEHLLDYQRNRWRGCVIAGFARSKVNGTRYLCCDNIV